MAYRPARASSPLPLYVLQPLRQMYPQLIFVSASTTKEHAFDSLSVPLAAILACKFEQPLFGSNYLVLEIRPSPEGGLTNGTKAEIRLKGKGLFEFVSALEKTRERAIYMRRSSCDEEEGLREYHAHYSPRKHVILTLIAASYTSPAGPSLSSTPAPPSDLPPAYDA